MELTNNELMNISGGAIHWGVALGVIFGISAFVAGVVDGYLRPYKCR